MEGQTEFQTMGLAQLQICYEQAKEHGKYFFVFDKTENVDRFYSYQASLNDFHKEVLKVTMGKQTTEEALETLRSQLVGCMRTGKLFVINCSHAKPDFKTKFTGAENLFPSAEIFNLEKWQDHNCNRKILKEGENYNMMGDKGSFSMLPEFRICILAKYTSDEDCQKLIDCVPDGENFLKFIIQ